MRTLPVFVYRLYGLLRHLFFCLVILMWLHFNRALRVAAATTEAFLHWDDLTYWTTQYTTTWPVIMFRSSSSTSPSCSPSRRAILRLIWWTLAIIQVLLLESGEGEKGE